MQQTIFITGGSSGIGNALARHFLATGRRVFTCSRRLAENLPASVQLECDLTDMAAIAALPGRLAERTESLDVLINNAGISVLDTVRDTTEADFDRVMATNMKAPFFLTQHLLKAYQLSHIVNVSSEASKRFYEAYGAYTLSKAALNAFTQICALEHPEIRTNTLVLGDIETEIWEAEDFAALRERNPLGRLGTHEDVASAVEFLLRSAMTGQELHVTGGVEL